MEDGGAANVIRLFGNLGADTFDFGTGFGTPSGSTTATADHIADFSLVEGDKLFLNVPAGFRYLEIEGSSVNSVEDAIAFANSHAQFGLGSNQGNVVFVAGATDGYLLLVDQNNSGGFGGSSDFAIILEHLNDTSLL